MRGLHGSHCPEWLLILASPGLTYHLSPTLQLSGHSTVKAQAAGKWSEHVLIPQSTDPPGVSPAPSPFSPLPESCWGGHCSDASCWGHKGLCQDLLPHSASFSSHWGWGSVEQLGGVQVFDAVGRRAAQSKGWLL